MCAKRTVSALKQKFTIIFCVGETLQERQSGITNTVLESQIKPLLNQITKDENSLLVIAYEPVWAIGTGVVAQVSDIDAAHTAIFNLWESKFPGACPPILYGGSVTPENLKDILSVKLVAGALIGGASLKYESMESMAKISEEGR